MSLLWLLWPVARGAHDASTLLADKTWENPWQWKGLATALRNPFAVGNIVTVSKSCQSLSVQTL